MSDGEEPWDGVEVYCPCGRLFRVVKSLRGGFANCPRCGRAVEVEAGIDKLFWALLGLGILAVVIPAGLLFWYVDKALGLVVLGLGAVIITIRLLAT